MNTRKILLGACAAAGVGIVLFFAGLQISGARFPFYTSDGFAAASSVLTTAATQSYAVEGTFSGIDAHTLGGDVRFARADDGVNRVEALENTTVEVNGGILKIRQPKQSFALFGTPRDNVTIYLAGDAYDTLDVGTASGDVDLPEWLTFSDVKIAAVSGEVKIDAQCGTMKVSSVSGDIKARGIRAQSAEFTSTSGEIELKSLTVEDDLKISTISGDIELDRCDAGRMTLGSTSGEIEGTLLSPKAFSAHTSSGKLKVPESTAGAGACEIKTVSGNVSLRIAS